MKRLMIAAMLCVFCLGASAAAAQQDDQACMQKGGTLTTDGKCMLTIDAKVSVDYPLDLAQNDFVASTIDPFIQSTKDQFMQAISDFIPAPGPYELDVTYDSTQHSDTMLTLIFTVYQFTGGAHGGTVIQTYTLDLKNKRLVTLDDLFTNTSDALAVIDPLVEQDLTTTLGGMLDANWLKQGTGTDPQNYQTFALDADSITFYFQQYQVAPYAAGIQKVTIPLAQLSSVLAPPFAS